MSTPPSPSSSRLPLIGAILAVVAVVLIVWLVFLNDDDEDTAPAADGRPAIVDPDDLSDVADRAGHPIYWVGEQDGKELELTETSNGRVYVRYLDEGTEPGIRSARFLTIATYPLANPIIGLRRTAKQRKGAELARSRDDAVVLVDPATPGSVRLAYPGSEQQIEVYSPDPKQALRLATSGDVEPVP